MDCRGDSNGFKRWIQMHPRAMWHFALFQQLAAFDTCMLLVAVRFAYDLLLSKQEFPCLGFLPFECTESSNFSMVPQKNTRY